MATTSEKIRINTLAKDFDMKSKDLLNILENAGYTGKTHMAVLEEDELNLLRHRNPPVVVRSRCGDFRALNQTTLAPRTGVVGPYEQIGRAHV